MRRVVSSGQFWKLPSPTLRMLSNRVRVRRAQFWNAPGATSSMVGGRTTAAAPQPWKAPASTEVTGLPSSTSGMTTTPSDPP